MIDIKRIRQAPADFDEKLIRRGIEIEDNESCAFCARNILAIDGKLRDLSRRIQDLQEIRNQVSRKVGELGIGKGEKEDLLRQGKKVKLEIEELSVEERSCRQVLYDLLINIPNILDDDVPYGKDSSDNVEIKREGRQREYSFTAKDHVALGESLGMMDFSQASKIAGPRFVILSGALAKLERALSSFMLDIHSGEFGYKEVSPPLLLKESAMFGTGQLPKFAGDLFVTKDNRWLLPTAEVPLTNCVAAKVLRSEELPLRLTASTACFRSEAGAAGKDTKGMIRQHQFTKVELVSIVEPQDSADELERMLSCAEAILKRLDLRWRVVILCSSDTGFAAAKTYDIEVWLASKRHYREISSCSNCRDFQTRRMQTRISRSNRKSVYAHSLNGSGLAVGRCLIALMEHYQTAENTIIIPDVLIPYMGGIKEISLKP